MGKREEHSEAIVMRSFEMKEGKKVLDQGWYMEDCIRQFWEGGYVEGWPLTYIWMAELTGEGVRRVKAGVMFAEGWSKGGEE